MPALQRLPFCPALPRPPSAPAPCCTHAPHMLLTLSEGDALHGHAVVHRLARLHRPQQQLAQQRGRSCITHATVGRRLPASRQTGRPARPSGCTLTHCSAHRTADTTLAAAHSSHSSQQPQQPQHTFSSCSRCQLMASPSRSGSVASSTRAARAAAAWIAAMRGPAASPSCHCIWKSVGAGVQPGCGQQGCQEEVKPSPAAAVAAAASRVQPAAKRAPHSGSQAGAHPGRAPPPPAWLGGPSRARSWPAPGRAACAACAVGETQHGWRRSRASSSSSSSSSSRRSSSRSSSSSSSSSRRKARDCWSSCAPPSSFSAP